MNEPSALTLDEILSVPGNRAVFDALVSSLRDHEAIAFVGAGASAGMYPLWDEFINLLAHHAVAEGVAEPEEAARWKSGTNSTAQQRLTPIVVKLGEARYRNFLKGTFAPRRDHNGRRYTEAHAALLRLPFRGYITTSHDPALDFARMALRPESLTTGTPTWQDDDEVYRWFTGDVFRRANDCPILWLHGYWQRPSGIAWNLGTSQASYRPGLYRRLFDVLWTQSRLVFVGFEFNDPQFMFMIGEYLREGDGPVPLQLAVLGLPHRDDGTPPDADSIREWREHLEADYRISPLFYPVQGTDHSALQTLLDAVADACARAVAAPVEPALTPEAVSAVTPEPREAARPSPAAPDTAARPPDPGIEVFISFKHLDENGEETRDFAIARNVATFLRQEGFRVFFSPESLEQIGTSTYKNAIDEALDSAPVLVAVGTTREHLMSKWVRYEWDGFLQDIIGGYKSVGELFTMVENMSPRELPRGLRLRQVFKYSDGELARMANFIRSKLKPDEQ
ncbi:MAG: toll/interleukin-1 receptor domain-containing protein [Pyrinomonadaceae bacterium]